jgi:predicted nucleic acid-binding protein
MTPTGVYDTNVIVSAILKPSSIPASLVALAMEGSVRLILSPAILLDEPDNRFLECAKTASAHYLVTGNKKHFPFPEFKGTKIVSPAEFAALLIPGS